MCELKQECRWTRTGNKSIAARDVFLTSVGFTATESTLMSICVGRGGGREIVLTEALPLVEYVTAFISLRRDILIS